MNKYGDKMHSCLYPLLGRSSFFLHHLSTQRIIMLLCMHLLIKSNHFTKKKSLFFSWFSLKISIPLYHRLCLYKALPQLNHFLAFLFKRISYSFGYNSVYDITQIDRPIFCHLFRLSILGIKEIQV